MTRTTSRNQARWPRAILLTTLISFTLAACQTGPMSSPPPVPDRTAGADTPVRGTPPDPLTLPLDLRGPVYTPAHMAQMDEIIRVAILLPFSADSSAARAEATQILRAAELALFERAGSNMLLLPKDTSGTTSGAVSAMEAAVSDGADLVIGPLLSESAGAISPLAREEGIPVLAFTTDKARAGDGVYMLSFPPGEEIRRVVEYTAGRGATRYAFIGPSNPYGETVAEEYRNAVSRTLSQYGAFEAQEGEDMYEPQPAEEEFPVYSAEEYSLEEVLESDEFADLSDLLSLMEAESRTGFGPGIVAEEFYFGDVQAMTEAAGRLARLGVEPLDPRIAARMSGRDWQPTEIPPFQVVILPEGGDRLRTLAPVLIYQEIDPLLIKFVGTSLWRNEDTAREPALANGWFAGPDPEARRRFEETFESVYGNDPSRLAGLGYDAASLAVLLGQQPDRYAPANLEDEDGFLGVDGLFRFRPDGTIERGLAVYTIQNGEFVVLDPAPQIFAFPVDMNADEASSEEATSDGIGDLLSGLAGESR